MISMRRYKARTCWNATLAHSWRLGLMSKEPVFGSNRSVPTTTLERLARFHFHFPADQQYPAISTFRYAL
jgi:hypothetical protein